MFVRGYFLQDEAGDGATGGAAGGAGNSGASGGDDNGGAAGAAGGSPWHGLTDPEAEGYVKNKGWQTPADVIKSYQGAEKLIGRDPNTLLVMPRADDPDGLRAVFAKLGMPESPDKYELDAPNGAQLDQAYADWAKSTFHKAGLTAAQAKLVSAEYNAYLKNAVDAQTKDYELSVEADKKALLQEWRGGHDRMLNSAKTAASALGFTSEVIDAIENKVGYAETMKMFAALGQKLGEDKFVSGEKRGGFSETMTPDEAKAQWDQTKGDDAFRKALLDASHPGHEAARQKQAKLFSIMYPEG